MASLLINIDVDDLKKATQFYCTALDLAVGRRFGHDAIELLGANAPIYLLAKPNGTVASASSRHLRSYARHWTPIHLDFVVDNIDAAVDKARNAGAPDIWLFNTPWSMIADNDIRGLNAFRNLGIAGYGAKPWLAGLWVAQAS